MLCSCSTTSQRLFFKTAPQQQISIFLLFDTDKKPADPAKDAKGAGDKAKAGAEDATKKLEGVLKGKLLRQRLIKKTLVSLVRSRCNILAAQGPQLNFI